MPPAALSTPDLKRASVVNQQDRTRGMLVGTSLGDALGRPFEGVARPDRSEVSAWAGARTTLTWTDDTAMTLALAGHLCRADGASIDAESLVSAFAEAWQREPWRGYGAGPPKIFMAHLAGRPWRETARSLFGDEGSFGNGGAMRVAPVAAIATDITDTAALARASASVTHAHPLGTDGAAVQAAAVFLALHEDGRLDRDGFLDQLALVAQTPEFSQAIGFLRNMPTAAEPDVLAATLGNGIEALRSVPAAIGAFLAHPDDPAAALLTAVLCGGDADTIAAMTGAIAGSYCGETMLPPLWLERLEDVDRIRHLADALARRRP
jgi:poly(ADP-ribose) glycohydrolase ARH3